MTHQLDRMEEMLVKLLDAHPGSDDSRIHKGDVAALVIGLIRDIASDRKIEAIKGYRHLTGHGLKESKDAIESVTYRFQRNAA